MSMLLTILSVLFVLGGFVGLFFGVIPSLVLWTLAACCIIGGWRSRSGRQRRREEQWSGHPTA